MEGRKEAKEERKPRKRYSQRRKGQKEGKMPRKKGKKPGKKGSICKSRAYFKKNASKSTRKSFCNSKENVTFNNSSI